MAESPRSRSPSAERSRAEILEVATAEFARNGFAGTRVDEIAARTRTTKRMIYYYFGGKEQLYRAVLTRAFTALHPAGGVSGEVEQDPLGVVVRFAALTYDRYRAHPDLGRLLIGENVSGGRRLPAGDAASETAKLERALALGAERGVIRAGVRACDVLMIVDSLCQFAISNRHTHQVICGTDPLGEGFSGRQVLADVVTAYLSPLRSQP